MKQQTLLLGAVLSLGFVQAAVRADESKLGRRQFDAVLAASKAVEDPLPAPLQPAHRDETPSPTLVGQSSQRDTNPVLADLHDKIRKVLDTYESRLLNTRDNDNWQLMHSIVAYGVNTQVFRGAPGEAKVNAIGWMCYNGACKGEQMLYLDRDKIVARKGPGVQGHYGQFLAILAQSRVKSDYPMRVGGKSFTIADLIEHEKGDCSSGDELTFKLIALAYYLDSDDSWNATDGQKWSISRLVQEELKQPIRGAACGGSHRLMGFSYAVERRIKQGKAITGEFRRAQVFLNDYHRYTFGMQNSDGSFSTEWFVRRGDKLDVNRRLQTTGHIAEWLSYSLSDEELRNPKMIKAVDYLAGILLQEPDRKWEIGPLGHGLHALAIYDSRISKPDVREQPKVNEDSDSPTLDPPTPDPLLTRKPEPKSIDENPEAERIRFQHLIQGLR